MKKIMHICETCGKDFHGRKTAKYCSAHCRDTSPSRSPWNKGKKGIAANRPRTGKYKNCPNCNKEFYVRVGSKYGHYCCMDCYLASRWEGHTEERTCAVCEKKFNIRIGDKRSTCSTECAKKYKRLFQLGEKSAFWRGGATAPYHTEWKIRRAEARERDGYKCVLCESVDRIQVHHIVPYRYSKSHALENLVTLCRSCHSKEELKVNQASRDGLLARWTSVRK